MVGDLAIKPKAAKPAIRQVQVHLFAQAPLGSDAETVSNQQHSDHQFGSDRGAPDRAVKCRQLLPQLAEFHKPVDRPR